MLLIALITALVVWILAVWIVTVTRRRSWVRSDNPWVRDHKPSLLGAIVPTLWAIALGPLATLITFLILSGTAGEPNLKHSTQLAALRTGTSVDGTFFLGIGQVDSEPVIRYITREPDGAAVLREIEANRARIYEDAGTEQPHLDIYCYVLTNPWLTPTPIGFDLGCSYQFHVPAGSVLESYEVTP